MDDGWRSDWWVGMWLSTDFAVWAWCFFHTSCYTIGLADSESRVMMQSWDALRRGTNHPMRWSGSGSFPGGSSCQFRELVGDVN